MPEMKRRETMWATMEPDVYSGPRCDEVRVRWKCWADGDKGGADHQFQPLSLDAKTFPPGTKITIEEPICPECGDLREPIHPLPKRGHIYGGKCRCGFDWDAWVLNEYS